MSIIKLLHIADVHLGSKFPSLRDKGNEYRLQLLRTFEKTVDLAISEGVSFFLIAGDLFDDNRIHGITVSKVLTALRRLGKCGIRVCILPGNHDPFNEDCIYRSLHLPENVILLTPDNSRHTYEDISLTVDGYFTSADLVRSLETRANHHIGMVHCSIKGAGIIPDGTMLLDREDIAKTGLDYLALGHWHSFQDISQGNTKACYSGAPEPIDLDQKGAGNVVIACLDGASGVTLTPLWVGSKKIETLTIDISFLETLESLVNIITAKADSDLILHLTLTGQCRMGFYVSSEDLENELSGHFFNFHVIDKSHPELGEVKSKNFPDKTVTGRYIKLLEERMSTVTSGEEKSVYEEALKYGFELLQGNSPE